MIIDSTELLDLLDFFITPCVSFLLVTAFVDFINQRVKFQRFLSMMGDERLWNEGSGEI